MQTLPTLVGRVIRAGRAWHQFSDGTLLPVVSGGDGTRGAVADPPVNPFIVRAREARATARAALDTIVNRAEGEQRATLTEEEQAEFDRLTGEIRAHDARIEELLEADERENRTARRIAGLPGNDPAVHVRREPLTYERHNRRVSYFKDLGMAHVGGDDEARGRLQRHRQEMDVEVPRREARMEAEFERALDTLSEGERRAVAERRDLSRVDGAGGELVPPLWLMDELITLARAGRPFLDLVRNIPLPTGTDSISMPRISGGTAVAAQTADNAAVAETDMTTDSINAPVRTYAGQQDVALQLLEQSPMVFDEIVFADLLADYNAKVDAAGLNGPGTAGTIKGLLAVAGINTITYTDASPTLVELWPKLADALAQAATNRKRVPNVWVGAPRRWFWATAALDGQSRPLIVPSAQGPYNSLASIRDQVFEGPAGVVQGLPFVLDPNNPIDLGAGVNEDRIIATLSTDHVLFEGALRTRALPEVLSGTLTVRLQLYRYVAFTAERYPSGTSVIAGTGLVTPTF